MPTLRELDAHFLQRIVRDGHVYHHYDGVTLANAHGVIFLCPKCFVANGGEMGTHSVICFFEGKVPDDAQPGPGRWKPTGTGIDDLTFVPGKKSHSVALQAGCMWHGFVTNGSAA